MENFDEIGDVYDSDLTKELLSKITPEEWEQTAYAMVLASMISAGIKAKGWKNIDLAKALKLKSPSLVSKWLSGTHNFTVETLVDIQRVLGIKLLNIDLDLAALTEQDKTTLIVQSSSINKSESLPLCRIIDVTDGFQPIRAAVAR